MTSRSIYECTDAQFGALHQLATYGPADATEIEGPLAMDGTCRVKLQCRVMSPATLRVLEDAGLVSVSRELIGRPISATGKRGHRRYSLTITITDIGRKVLEWAP
jgi:hypothetical protein